ncbi:MAG: hypothetical protein J0I41_20880 [Filimonas sp.]|nr:hypothetical protein [Filimonas sp.]
MKRISLLIAGLFFLLDGFINVSTAQSVSVSPSRCFFTATPGQTASQVLAISNSSNQPVIFKASFKDFKRDSLGEKIYFDKGTLPLSNANWMEVTPDVIELAPNQQKTITITMRVPQNAGADQNVFNSMLFLSQVNEQQAATSGNPSAAKSIGIRIRLEIGIHIYNTPPVFTKKNISFAAFDDITRQTDTIKHFAVKIKNTGEIIADAQLRFEITDKSSGDEIHLPSKAISMLPGTEQVVQLDLPSRLKGKKYLIVALLDTGVDSDLKVAEKEVAYD